MAGSQGSYGKSRLKCKEAIEMEKLNEVLKTMDFSFFGSGKHKISPSIHLTENNSLFLDVRSNEEFETIAAEVFYLVFFYCI